MKIKLHEIPVRDVVNGYIDSAENGVVGYGGKLNIRPAFQREFIYKDKQRDEVMRTIRKDFPLNVMYWVKSDNGGFELLNGQQRTISICQYVQGDFSIDHMAFHNLTKTEQEQILNYPLMIYICEGTDKENIGLVQNYQYCGRTVDHARTAQRNLHGRMADRSKEVFQQDPLPSLSDCRRLSERKRHPSELP